MHVKHRTNLEKALEDAKNYSISENFDFLTYKNKLEDISKKANVSKDILAFWDLAMNADPNNKKYLRHFI